MHLSQYPEPYSPFLFRYFHIYFQKLFFWLAGDPFLGARHFWAFLISGTAVVTYGIARIYSQHSRPIHGFLAVLFFFASDLILPLAGTTYADFTLMFTFTIGIGIYLLSIKKEARRRNFFLFCLGFVFVLSFKSKEPGFLLGAVFIGLAFNDAGRVDLHHFFRSITFVSAGIGIGLLLFFTLDHYLLNNFAFQSTPANIQNVVQITHVATAPALFDEYVLSGRFFRIALQWITFFFEAVPEIFFLYLIAFAKMHRVSIQPKFLPVWILPMLLPLAFILTRWDLRERYYLPALPLIIILAVQFLKPLPKLSNLNLANDFLNLKRDSRTYILFLLITVYAIYKVGREINAIQSGIIFPVSIIVIIILATQIREWDSRGFFAAVLCVLLLTSNPIGTGIQKLTSKELAKEYEGRIAALQDFDETVDCSPSSKVYVSRNVHFLTEGDSGGLGRDQKSNLHIFSLYYQCDFSIEQFYYSNPVAFPNDFIGEGFTHGILWHADWARLSPGQEATLLENYEVKRSLDERYIYLVRNSDRDVVQIHSIEFRKSHSP